MAVFIELVTSIVPDQISKFSGVGKTQVRRPLRGIEIKEDTYAYIKLVRMDGKEIDLVDSSSSTGYSNEYSNFILQSVQEQRMERHQIIETFGDSFLFIFGEAPRFLQVSAVLLNTFDFNWKAEFMHNYDNFLRGTKSLEKGARTYLFYDENVVEGYILNASIVQESQQAPYLVQLQFQFYVTNHRNVSLIQTEGNFPIRSTAVVPDGVDLTKTLDDPTLRQLVEYTAGPQESGFANMAIARTRPIRSKTSDNSDEYTTPMQPTAAEAGTVNFDQPKTTFFNPNDTTAGRNVEDVNSAVSQTMQGYGVPPESANNPFTANDMGLGPTFLPGGVGVGSGGQAAGSMATFGATPGPGYAAGFAGAGVGIGGQAGSGYGAFGGAYAGVGLGARNGSFAGGAYPSQQYANNNTTLYAAGRGSTFGTSSPLSGNLSAAELAYALATGNIFSFRNVTGRGVGQQAAYGYPNNDARAGYDGYAYSLMRASSRAGGYAGAGSYLGYPGYYSYMGASSAGQSGAGASVFVGGAVSAFSFTSLPGTLTNTDLSTPEAMSLAGPGAPTGLGWSWP